MRSCARHTECGGHSVGLGYAGAMSEPEDYYNGDYLQDVAESRLLELGGRELLAHAQRYAGENADVMHPWDGTGPEPEARVSEYIGSLWRYIELIESRQRPASS